MIKINPPDCIMVTATLIISAMLVTITHADNPVADGTGVSDPHVHIYNDTAYLYSGHDTGTTSSDWLMPDWRIYKSADLIHWTLARTISPKETYIASSSNKCWAGDAAFRNGTYYFYFSNHNTNMGVMTSKSPTGPFTDALGKPLMQNTLTPTLEYDPTVFMEDSASSTSYVIFGQRSSSVPYYYIAKLNADMISLAEAPKAITINGNSTLNDKNFLIKRNGTYYLSYGSSYATSTSIYGPYTYIGESGSGYGLGSDGGGYAHGSFFEWHGQWYHIWCRYLNHDATRMRDSRMTYVHFKNNGNVADDADYLKAHYSTGVGQYDASWDKIQAEWFFADSGAVKKELSAGGFAVQNNATTSYLYFPNVRNIPKNCSMSFHVASASSSGATIEIRKNTIGGTLLGSCGITATGSSTTFVDKICQLTNTDGTNGIYLVLTGDSNLDWFKFSTSTSNTFPPAAPFVKCQTETIIATFVKNNNSLHIRYTTPPSGPVVFKLYDIQGHRIKTFNVTELSADHTVFELKLSGWTFSSQVCYLVTNDNQKNRYLSKVCAVR